MKNELKKRIYLDYAASTPIDPAAKKEMYKAIDTFANSSAIYESGRRAKDLIVLSKKNAALFLQANPEEINFTSGATESNNIAIIGSCKSRKNGRIITLKTEHASSREPIDWLAKKGFDVVYVGVDATGIVNLDEFRRSLSEDTVLVSIAYVSSETGTVQPISKISRIIKQFNIDHKTDVLLHTDASAAALTLSCDVSRLGVDLLSLGSQKLYGPSGVGLLYIKRGTKVDPIEFGGANDVSIKPGTQPTFLFSAFAKALEITKKRRKKDLSHFKKLNDYMLAKLESKSIQFQYNGSKKDRIHNIINISLPNQKGLDIVSRLDARGIEVSTGAACEVGNDKPSETLLAIGRSERDANASIRVSLGRKTTQSDIKQLVENLFDIITKK